MSELPSTVTERTVKQIEQISDMLFERAIKIPGVAPDTEDGRGMGYGAGIPEYGVVCLVRHYDPKGSLPDTQLWAGTSYDKVEIQDYRPNPAGSYDNSVVLRREHGPSNRSYEMSANHGTYKRDPDVRSDLTVENVTSTQTVSDEEARYFAAKFFHLTKKYISHAELYAGHSD